MEKVEKKEFTNVRNQLYSTIIGEYFYLTL